MRTLRWTVLCGFFALPVPSANAAAQWAATGLHLDDVLALAEARNPGLSAVRFSADAAAFREPAASTLPDPVLQLGFMNFGLPELNTDMAMSMAPAIQLSQALPWPGKRARAGEVAGYDREIAQGLADEESWAVRVNAARIFYDIYSLDRRIEVMRETLGLLESFQEVARAMYAAGTGRQTDVLRADVEVARMAGDVRRMEAQRRGRAARLNAVIGAPAESPVGRPVLDPLPVELPSRATLERWARESRPALRAAELGVRRAESRSALADKQIWPDVMLGLSYGQRDRGAGTERMGSAMVGVSIPIHAGRRQHALSDAADADWRMAEARLGGSQADVDARIGEILADLETARVLVELYRDEVVPDARVTVESAFSSYRVSTVDFMTLVDAQMVANRYEAELYALLASYGASIAALESAVGRVLPRDGPTVSEVR